jgi:hypothetical protein
VSEHLIRIEAPHFVAGADLRDDVVICAAPIIGYMIGWNYWRLFSYCEEKRWRVEVVWAKSPTA